MAGRMATPGNQLPMSSSPQKGRAMTLFEILVCIFLGIIALSSLRGWRP